MNRLRIICLWFVCAALSICTGTAYACKFKTYDIADYTEGRISGSVVFHGVVVSVAKKTNEDNSLSQEIEFRVVRWFAGKPLESAIVIGEKGIFRGTDCEGVFDFSAQKDQEWLIFGHFSQGKISPDKQLSIRLINGNIPPSLLEQLK